ncbi:MAG: thioredoxin fold domain-containing protein [Verrucomicrobiaceae bacterium]|jgi:thioredoxin-related protein|nr:thioredoxin fold domain-containing protein [Verrucomicrobiaceae bacterium]
MIMKKTILASLLLALTVSLSTAAGDEWMTDFEAAKQKAAAENKDLLVNFTGSDWCSWCIKLVDEVFKHDAFKKGVADNFVLVELDFPQDKSKLDESTQKQNEMLQEKYSIQGFPTILLLDDQGRPYAQTGYQAGGPEKYLAHLDKLLAIKTKRDEALMAAEKLEGPAKAKSLVEALKLLPEGQLNHYSKITQQIAALDPSDESGFVAGQKLKEAADTLNKEYMTAVRSGKNDEAIAMVDKFIADFQITGEKKQSMLGMKMNPLLASQQFDQAAELLDEIVALAPESQIGKFASNFMPKLEKMKQDAAAPRVNPPHGQPGHIHNE